MAEKPRPADEPRETESRTMGKQILDVAGEQPPHDEETPLTGASRASTPRRPARKPRAPNEDPALPPGAR
jgi:hypothetical protein